MSDFELWNYLNMYSQMSNGWWYSVAALPAAIIGGCTYLLMWFALRHETNLPKLFLWLSIASVPLILIMPSYYVSIAPRSALARIGFPVAADAQHISRETTLQLGRQLSQLATLGIIGGSLSLALVVVTLLLGNHGPALPIFEQVSQRFTKAVTRAFGSRRMGQPLVASPYGLVKITRGQQQGTQFGIKHGALVGKEQATMTITDDIVSRRHARFDVRNDLACLVDEGSMNGTYIRRNGSTHELNGDGFPLEHGDQIFLGHPDEDASVALVFERAV
jgi:hypothetical protein